MADQLDIDDIIKFMVENSLCSIPSHRAVTIYDPPRKKPKIKQLPYDHPVSKHKRGEISSAELCKVVGINQKYLLPYLIKTPGGVFF